MPSKATGTYWIAYILQSMSSLVDKFGLYLQPFENVIAGTVKQTNCATFEGKTENDVRCCCFITKCSVFGSFRSCKEIQLMSQQEDFAIIEMVDQRDDMFLCSWPTPL